MTVHPAPNTVADLAEIESMPGNEDRRFELIQGEIEELAAPSPTHAYTAGEIYAAFRAYARQTNAGYAFSDSVSYQLSDIDAPIPDASYISKARLPALPKKITVAPDVAVEVVSPSETYNRVMRKVATYLRYGTRIVLVVDQEQRTMAVHTSEGSRILTVEDVFDGGEVMPGFRLAVRDIFPPDDTDENSA